MYKRDVAVVLLSCLAILVSLQHEGSFSFNKAWYHNAMDDGQDLYIESHQLPPPVVVIEPRPASRHGEGFAVGRVIIEVSLLYKRVMIAAGRRPVALSVGYIDPLPKEHVRAPRKQVVVVLTASWQVLCFDHNLKLLWEKDMHAEFPHHAHIKEVAVHVSPHQVREGDRGLVVVGASIERGDLASGEGLEDQGQGRMFSDADVLLREMRIEDEESQHARSAGAQDTLSDLDSKDDVKGLDSSRHFNYYAFEGASGEERWHHRSTDFHKDLDSLSQELRPQNDYRLDAEKLEGRHFSEASCREYRESLLHVLPHAWSRPADTRLEEAHFVKHKVGRGAQKEALGAKGKKGMPLPKIQAAPKHAEHVGFLSDLLGSLSSKSRQHQASAHPHVNSHWQHHGNLTANALVAYLEEGIEVIHLFSAQWHLDAMAECCECPKHHNTFGLVKPPGVPYTGRTVCKLHLPPGTLHADLNGDGVVDHVQVYHGLERAADDVDSDINLHRPSSHCKAIVTSGIPPRMRLFEVNVCKTNKFMQHMQNSVFQQSDSSSSAGVELLTPIMLPIPQISHGYRSHRSQHGIIIFMTNKGEITAVNARGQHLWQNYFPTSWPAAATAQGEIQRVVPTLKALALRRHAVPTAILAVGKHDAVILSEHGHILDAFWLPFPPTKPAIITDFNGDGLNDIMIVTARGIFGYAQTQHIGGFTLSALLVTLIIAMGIVYYTQLYDGGAKKGRRLRSTDYTD